jgi:hypothetical protein
MIKWSKKTLLNEIKNSLKICPIITFIGLGLDIPNTKSNKEAKDNVLRRAGCRVSMDVHPSTIVDSSLGTRPKPHILGSKQRAWIHISPLINMLEPIIFRFKQSA